MTTAPFRFAAPVAPRVGRLPVCPSPTAVGEVRLGEGTPGPGAAPTASSRMRNGPKDRWLEVVLGWPLPALALRRRERRRGHHLALGVQDADAGLAPGPLGILVDAHAEGVGEIGRLQALQAQALQRGPLL